MTLAEIVAERRRGFDACGEQIAREGEPAALRAFHEVMDSVTATSEAAVIAYWRGFVHRLVSDTFE
jgi:hypothetical protein